MSTKTKKPKSKKGRKRQSRWGQPQPDYGFRSLILQPNRRQMITWRNMVTVNNAGAIGASQSFQLFVPNTLSPTVRGLGAMFGAVGTAGLYNACRLLAVRARASLANGEAFAVRAALVLGTEAPANNAIITQANQNSFMSRTASVCDEKLIGALTGNAISTLGCSASNARTLGVKHVKGLADAYTNYYDVAGNIYNAALNGITLSVLLQGSANLVSGVTFDIEADLLCEFFQPNPINSS